MKKKAHSREKQEKKVTALIERLTHRSRLKEYILLLDHIK